jgi:large subunit ribosomal protein L3
VPAATGTKAGAVGGSTEPNGKILAMCRGLLGKKLGMTGYFTPEGESIPVTVVELGPCVVTQVKTVDKDGYNALQIGFGSKKAKRVSKPMQGHLKTSGAQGFACLREVPVDKPEDYRVGQTVTLDVFEIGERVDVIGTSKGRGFAGVIKRHGFHRGPMTHGSKNIRPPGSIGTSAWPSRVLKGKKMPGHYGTERKTIRNLQIVDIRPAENLVLIRGAVPGAASGLVLVRKPKFGNK